MSVEKASRNRRLTAQAIKPVTFPEVAGFCCSRHRERLLETLGSYRARTLGRIGRRAYLDVEVFGLEDDGRAVVICAP